MLLRGHFTCRDRGDREPSWVSLGTMKPGGAGVGSRPRDSQPPRETRLYCRRLVSLALYLHRCSLSPGAVVHLVHQISEREKVGSHGPACIK